MNARFVTWCAWWLAAGCSGNGKDDGTGDVPTDADTDTDTDTDADTDADADADTDTDTDTDTDPGPVDWTVGPALPACTPSAGSGTLVALSGVVLTSGGPVGGHVVYDRATGTIVCAGDTCDTTDATVVCTEGVIGPALIDGHDHTQYNVLAPWQHADLYDNRYEWQRDGDYYDYREAYDAMEAANGCEIVKWAELRQIVGGAGSVVGSTDGTCVDVLARNLDETAASGLSGFSLEYSSSRVEYLDDGDAAARLAELGSGATEAFLEHVAEGVFGTVRAEIDRMSELGLVGPGNVYVHATDASVEQLARMAVDGTGIVWSPRSNLDLYADTTMADVALRVGVPVVIGPDWTWSGSNTTSAELSCAWDWLRARGAPTTDRDLVDMATVDTSVLFGLQGRLGVLDPGAEADLSVWAWRDQPYRAVIEAEYEDVRLVIVDGQAKYGVPDLVAGLEEDPAWCETVVACTEDRTLCVQEAATGDDAATYADLEGVLSAALAATSMPAALDYANDLYPLWACGETRAACDLSQPTGTDGDGDGVDDVSDLCPTSYDPRQTDHDDDGLGDACDPCPLTSAATCAHDLADIDDDGIPNEDDGCPYLGDPGNPDGDGDRKPDACDACPTVSNPGEEGCPLLIADVRDPSSPLHPAEGTAVTLSNVVVTGVSSGGFFVQDPSATEFGALYVYGDTSPSVGQLVTVSGTYEEYFGLTELTGPTVTIQGAGALPAPIVAAPCDVGTGGADAERFESMLVSVANVSVSDTNPDAPSDYDEFEVDGCLRVDDLLCASCWLDQPANGTLYSSITGPLTYSFSNTKLVPRDAADLLP
jgi:cytosine/adenosine deaminase-related metal-dependent hydrolase